MQHRSRYTAQRSHDLDHAVLVQDLFLDVDPEKEKQQEREKTWLMVLSLSGIKEGKGVSKSVTVHYRNPMAKVKATL